ncbi:ribonuclease E inhibitor RraB [Rheinheimera muenzenbergensis]|uniref:Regulator of ribonuclease activity B n=1 Tax=Rheinheimera muenzenbergensis TaxID=1193628 RepID=A0ABU8C3U3_9GAMM|nr:ribonuclease E inhibitor RraB [Gammaproteobacteria bacterium]MBU1553255.1 ribonuclease E inhibitor RraB [Gammaproteobacteria bacterium]MBU2069006.1 ribonuclease E inhibitor RraB [Gammaproteobacteria bacterium]MBU2183229.1 ribonuclease E inhibitor RraB [Gammaproteobacteria bacterium]MBU2204609.1 ribonuclease E inhibitor RraB [Gammaproteobacteria bacterium]
MENWQEFTEDTIAALLEDGSDPDALYTIEHHFYDKDFAKLEKLAVELFKLGYEVTDAEEVEFEDGGNAWVFDAIREQSLDTDSIVADAIKLEELAKKHKVEYDGWGTYFEGDEDEFELEDDEE